MYTKPFKFGVNQPTLCSLLVHMCQTHALLKIYITFVVEKLLYEESKEVLDMFNFSKSSQRSYPSIQLEFRSGVGCLAYDCFHIWQVCVCVCVCVCLESVRRSLQRMYYIGSWWAELILACQDDKIWH
jgi:hypothetical protein